MKKCCSHLKGKEEVMVKDYFKACEKRFPKFQSELRRIS